MKSDTPFRQDRLHFYSIRFNTGSPSFFSKLRLCISDFGLHSVAVYRFGRAAHSIYTRSKLIGFIPVLIYKIMNLFVKTIHHVDISSRAEIGPGFFIMHYYTILIGSVKAGRNLTVHHNLTIGQRVAGLDRSIPEIGDDVWIGPNCVITGDIKIGQGATISAGTVLTRSVRDYSLVGGNPGRVIIHDYDNKTMSVKKSKKP